MGGNAHSKVSITDMFNTLKRKPPVVLSDLVYKFSENFTFSPTILTMTMHFPCLPRKFLKCKQLFREQIPEVISQRFTLTLYEIQIKIQHWLRMKDPFWSQIFSRDTVVFISVCLSVCTFVTFLRYVNIERKMFNLCKMLLFYCALI